MARLLVVHHTPSPALHTMLEAVRAGATAPEVPEVEVSVRAALSATASDVLAADGYVIGGPANLGYLAGAVKHFFDTVYYPCLSETAGLPYALYVHGNNDTAGAVRAVESIAKGLSWHRHRPPVTVVGDLSRADREACWELGAVTALAAAERAADAPDGA